MSSFKPKQFILNNVNSGNKYEDGEGLQPSTANDIVEGVAYCEEQRQAMVQAPAVVENGGNVDVKWVDTTINGRTHKKLQFENIKGDKGDKGEKGKDGADGVYFADIEVGEVNTQMISTELPAEVNINKIIDSGKTKLNFDFSLPKPYEDSVTGLVYESQIVGESVTINNTNDGFIDEITLEGNTIGGNGTPETPIAIQSVESPIGLTVCGKNLFDKTNITISTNTEIYNNGLKLTKYGSDRRTNIIPLILSPGSYRLSFNVLENTTQSDVLSFLSLEGTELKYLSGTENFTLTKKAEYIKFYIPSEDVDGAYIIIDNIQIEKGVTATEYEPYQGTTISIPIKDINNNPITLNRLSDTIYDRLYKFENKWWVEKKTDTAILSPDWNWGLYGAFDNNPNNNYFFTGAIDNLLPSRVSIALSNVLKNASGILYKETPVIIEENSFSAGASSDRLRLAIHNSIASDIATFKNWLTTNPVKILYTLATPEIIQLSEDTANALESLKTYKGTTNIFGTNTVNPILDVTELAMGIGEKKYALLTDGDGNAVMPVNEADNTLMFDGRTVEQGLQELRKDVDNLNLIPYDIVIRTQTEFEALYKSDNWLDAESVALVGQFVYDEPDNSGIKIPDTVKQIHGFNSAKITVTNFVYNSSTAKGGLWYDTLPTTNDYSICDLEVDCTGTNGRGFYFCTNLTNCTGTGTGTNGRGFYFCTNLTNCTGTGTATDGDGYGFYFCTNLTNCTGTGTATDGYGFRSCTNLTNCTGTGTATDGDGYGFYKCTNLTNCTGRGSYGFYDITTASNCKDGGSSTDMWGGSNKNIDIETCRKNPATANNSTLNT